MFNTSPLPEEHADKIRASILGGAIGDALGAPLEGERDFQVLFDKFGHEGVKEFVDAISPWDNKVSFQRGDTTDDTASIVGVIAALNLSRGESQKQTIHNLWQANVVWGAKQKGGEGIAQFIDASIDWPEWYIPFFNSMGAGRGTLGALSTGHIGTPEKPLGFDRIIGGKRVVGPNKGCGGMMRVAPVALLPLSEGEIIDLATRSTAITHGADEAQAAAVVVALTIRNAFNHASVGQSALKAMETVEEHKLPGHELCADAFDAAMSSAATMTTSTITANEVLSTLGYKNQFAAIPVLSQVMYGALIADGVKDYHNGNSSEAFLQTLAYCTTIAGDSDSVGSMLGNILGAAWGSKALPQHLLNGLGNRNHIEQAVGSLVKTVEGMSHEFA